MRKILLIILGLLVVVIGVFAIVVALQPADYRVTRSTTMSAPKEIVFAQVNEFQKWETWSPWLKIDPKATYEYVEPKAGEGAIFTWAGNSQVGKGRMTIMESKPHELIRIKLDFIEPYASTATAEFTFKEKEGGKQTEVTWAMNGNKDFVQKAVFLVMNMEKELATKFDEGLAAMKTVVETPAKK